MEEAGSSYSDHYDVLKKLCRQQLLLNESLKLELSKVSKLLQKVSQERDTLINELLENHSNSVIPSENKDLVAVQQGQLSQSSVQKRRYSSPGVYHGIPTKSRKESITDHSGYPGTHLQVQNELECRESIDTGFEDLEIPVIPRLKSPHRSPGTPYFEGSQTRLPRTCHPNDRTLHLPTSPSPSYVNNTCASDGVWPSAPVGSESPPAVTTLTRATKPTTLLANSLVVSSTSLLSQRPTLVASQSSATTRIHSTGVGMAPPMKLAFGNAPRPRLVTNVPLIGKPTPLAQSKPSLYATNLMPGQQRIVIQTSGSGINVAQGYHRAPVPAQNPIRSSPSENC